MPNIDDFTAAPQMIGYFYQSQVALLLSCRKLSEGVSTNVSLETLDDIEVESDEACMSVTCM